ncbi:hypothetical protein [Methylobacterium indicum]|uniref:hypothetical protein n=1 Tax=Methylobacterium indicum TaxID=1775910 RepID=UPI000F7A8466|nr:hypothetical protein [Methylobacterium indicum]
MRAAHRLYLAALMQLEALEGEDGSAASESEYANAQFGHAYQFKLLNGLLVQLGYVPKGLATRAEIQRELAAEKSRRRGRRPGRTARAEWAEMPVRSA